MNEDGTLQEGSLAIDAGNNAFLGFRTDGKTDINGSQRIYNGTVDIGCSEFDWRAKYSAAMGAGVTVTNASPGVTLEGGRVRLVAGCALDGTWRSPAPGVRVKYSFAADVVTGRLTGEVGPQAVDAASSGSWMFRTEAPVGFDFSFAGGGYGELYGFTRRMSGFTMGFR